MNLEHFWIANTLALSLVLLFLLQSTLLGVLYVQWLRQRFFGGSTEGALSPLEILVSALCGSMITGVLFFSLGHLRLGLNLTAWFLLAISVALFFWRRVFLFGVMASTVRSLIARWSKAVPAERWVFAAVFTIALTRSLSTTAPQTHGDQYLYHLTVGKIWDAMGYPGIDVLNVASGYSWSVESIYAYLYQFSGTGMVHILASQQIHCLFGFFGLLLVTYKIIRLGLGRIWSLLLLVLFMNPYLTQMTFFAKNDATSFLLVWILVWAVLVSLFAGTEDSAKSLEDRPWQIVLAIAPFLLAAKITAAIGCAVVGACALFARPLFSRQKEFARSADAVVLTRLGFWVLLAALSIIGILPYLLSAGLQTGNPLFPIFNNVFRSPLMPLTANAIVQEMSPFSAGPLDLLRGASAFAKDHPVFLLVPPALFFSWGVHHFALRVGYFLLGAGLIALLAFQLLLNTYGSSIEQRHFKLASYSLTVATILLCSQIAAARLRWACLGTLVLVGIVHLQIEVNFRDVIRRMGAPDLRAYLFDQKPLNSLLETVNDDRLFCDQCSVYIVGNLVNEGYYLNRGHLLHQSISAPLFAAGSETEIVTGLEQSNRSWPIRYGVIAAGQSEHPGSQWIRKRMTFVARSGELSLYRLKD